MEVKHRLLCCWWIVSLLPGAGLAAGPDLRLVQAVESQNRQAVRSLLEQKADVNAAEADGASAIAWAAHWDDLQTADLLIRAGANVNAANVYGVTPLSLACLNGSAAMVEKLLKAGANPNAAQLSGETPLMTCAKTGNLDAVRWLFENKADANAKESSKGQTALMWAVAERHPQIVRELVQHGADFRARSKGGFTAMLFAAQQGDVESARILLDAGTNVNETTQTQEHAEVNKVTYGARQSSEPDSGSAAANRTPNPGQRGSGQADSLAASPSGPSSGGTTPLLVSSASGQGDFSIFLLEHGADPNAADGRGFTALHYAAQSRVLLPLVKALLAHQANPNARLTKNPPGGGEGAIGMIGATPFLLAAQALNAAAMRELAAGGADPRIATKQNTTALMVAAGVGRFEERTQAQNRSALEAVQAAAELGVDVNAVGDNGWTALHGAAYTGADAIIQFLVEKGAKMDVKDKFGQTPLSIASAVITAGLGENADVRPRRYRTSTVNLLVKLGAPSLEASGVDRVGSLAVMPAQ